MDKENIMIELSPALIQYIVVILSVVLAFIGVVLLLTFFLNKKNITKLETWRLWIYDVLNFRLIYSDLILKVLYLFLTIFITVYGVINIFIANPILTITLTILVNLLLRVFYEIIIILVRVLRKLDAKYKEEELEETKIPKFKKTYKQKFCSKCGKEFEEADIKCVECNSKRK